ncbi:MULTISPECIES: hypothetical protein [Sorangium]|uniref:Secreted protein n=1 Tax=Sorangium cellulosum TaxID=56 RepID=A0A4P2QM68_SORCE|nr:MULTISPECIES: hypothetical protein [Sorangium]AUX31177.1 hypothetical protein SOCE836_033050 [Sorangium cellulosum]WCQ90561.1 hypothetical protein NQZ70_03272 [Sorangium sp. Soce836]
MKSNRSIHLALAMGALAVAPALSAAQTGSTSPPQQRESGTPGAAHGGAQQQGGARGTAQGGAHQGGAQQQGDQHGASSGQRAQQQQQQQQGQRHKAMTLKEQISFKVEEGCTYTASVNGRIEPAAAGKSQQPSGAQPGGGPQGRGGAGAQGQTGGAAQGPAGGSQAQAGGAQDRSRDTGGSQAPAGGAPGGSQAGGAQGGSQAHAGAQAGGAQGGQAGSAQGGGQAGAGAGAQEKVKPNLTVSASMSCPNAPELRVTDTLKTDTAVTRSELEGMISRRASIATEKSGRFCMYVPQFELTGEKLSGRGIAQLCRVPAADQKQGMR